MNKDNLINNLRNRINFNGYSYIAYLATQNKNDIILELTSQSPETIYEAIYGYAVVKNSTQLNIFIDKSLDKAKAKKITIQGLVRGNHLTELYKIEDYKLYKTDIVFGHAQAGAQQQVASLVNRYPMLFEAAVQGYASAGHTRLLLDLLKGTRFYAQAIYQAAKAGHNDTVNKLLMECGITETTSCDLLSTKEEIRLFGFMNKALAGYCNGYHLDLVADLLQKGADIQTALDALKIGYKPCLDSYVSLLIVIPENNSEIILKKIQTELQVLNNNSLSAEHIENIKNLHEEYLSTSNSNLLTSLSEGYVVTDSNIFEQLETFYLLKKDESQSNLLFPNS